MYSMLENILKHYSGSGAQYALQDSIINNLIYGGLHSGISGELKKSDILKGYHESDSGFYLHHNIAEELVNSMIEDIFFNRYKEWYISDKVFKLKFFTDCHTLDATRLKFTDNPDYTEKKLGDGELGHIMARDKFINEYIDHRKGPRKGHKHSPEWRRRNG